jgi:hypothetical protein
MAAHLLAQTYDNMYLRLCTKHYKNGDIKFSAHDVDTFFESQIIKKIPVNGL